MEYAGGTIMNSVVTYIVHCALHTCKARNRHTVLSAHTKINAQLISKHLCEVLALGTTVAIIPLDYATDATQPI